MIGIDLRLIGIDGIDARAADAAGANVQVLAHDHASDPHGAEQGFVAGKGDDVDSPRIHADGKHTGALACVDHQESARLPGNLADGFQILHRSEHVGSMIDHDHPGLGRDGSTDIVRIHVTLCVPCYMCDVHAMVALQMSEGAQDGIVLEAGRHHMVAALEQPEKRNVQRISGVLREHHAVRIAAVVEKRGQQPTRLLDHLFRLHGQLVAGAARVDPVVAEELVHGGVDHLRLGPAGRSVIEVVVVFHSGGPMRELRS